MKWPKVVMLVITGFFGLMVLASAIGGNNTNSESSTTQPSQAPQEQVQPTLAPTNTPELTKTVQAKQPTTVKAANTPSQVKQSAPATGETVSQKNAVRKAQSYLGFSGFSHDGLVTQLEFEKFSHEDAVYGADHSGANWNEQAAKKAKSYMDISAYSRDGLIQQLMFEKFTQEQAEYGANAVGL